MVFDPVTMEPVFYGADRRLDRAWFLNLTVYL